MRILYIASGIPLPGALGGSTHTREVARGLARRGHDVHVVACADERAIHPATLVQPARSWRDEFTLYQIDVPKSASLLAAPAIAALARQLRPALVMERYYNLAGGGMIAARRLGIPTLLEVNALIVDPPAVRKRRIDDALGGPLRRWAETQCRWASRIVTPLHTTVPASIPRAKIVELPWGADVAHYAAVAATRRHAPPRADRRATVVFLGSFRAWHGVLGFMRAATMLLEAGVAADFLLVGDGPERQQAEREAARWPGRFVFSGAVPYERVPALLGSADVGVAPFDTAPHPALRAAGFFWSPLKIYEYMAAGLPVVTAAIPPLTTIIRDGVDGLIYPEGDIAALAGAIRRLVEQPEQASQMGASGCVRVAERYSWDRHCAALDDIIGQIA